ncbi:MAG: translocation/assembly module TamB domain-containing protein [Dongia sp.]
MRRALCILLGLLAVLVILLLAVFGVAQTGFGKRQILARLESAVADPPARLQAAALEGLVPFDMQLVGVSLSDQQGVWLEADRAAITWSPMALFGKTLRIDALDVDRLAVHRSPVSPPPQGESAPPRFPTLPVDIDLRRLQVDRLELGAEFLGEPAVFNLGAQARIGDPAQGLQAVLHLKRTDRDNDTADLDLDYRPDTDSLKLDVKAAEPQGGLITKMLGLPGKPDFRATIAGEGPLDRWQAKGDASADDRPILQLTASSTGAATDRKIAFDVTLPNLPMLPEMIGPLVQGGITASGTVHLAGAGGPIHIDTLKAETAAGTVSASGDVDSTGLLNLRVQAQLADAAAFRTLLPPELGWRSLDADLQIGGTIGTPRLTVDATVGDLAYAGNTIGKTSVSAAAILHTDTMRADGVTASINAETITLADPKLQPLLTDGVRVDFAGALDESGGITADHLTVDVGPTDVALRGSATGWGDAAAHLEGTASSPDLSTALALAGLKGGGALAGHVRLDKDGEALAADLDATLSKASLGIPAIDGLLGPQTRVTLTARRDADGLVTLESARVESPGVQLGASGTVSARNELDLKLDAALTDVSRVLPAAKGNIVANAHVLGPADNPHADAAISNGTLHYDRFTLTGLKATVAATDLATGPKAKIGLTGSLNDLPLSMALDGAVDTAKNRITADGIKIALGGTSVSGKAAWLGTAADGSLTLASTDLGEIGKLLGQDIHGVLDGQIALSAPKGKQSATVKARLKSLTASGATAGAATVDASGTDLLGDDPGFDAALAATQIKVAGESIDHLSAKAAGTLSTLNVSVDASGPSGSVSTAATVRAKSGETAITLAKLDLAINQVQARLLNPAEITLRGGEARVANLAIGARDGTLRLDAALTEQGNTAELRLERLPLSVLDAAGSDLHFMGTVDAALDLHGTKQAPDATLDLKGTGLGVQNASEQLADLTLQGTWRAGVLQSKGRLALTKSSALDFTASLPVAADPANGLPRIDSAAAIDARAQGKLDLGLANAFIPGGADHIAGLATIDLAAKGPLDQPSLSGSGKITDGAYENQRYGTRLRDLTVDLSGEGSKLKIVSLSATTPGGGKLGGGGDVDFGGAQAVNVTVTMSKARMINAPIGTAVTDGNLAFKGSLRDHVDLTGTVKVVRAEIRIPDRLPVDVEEIPVVEVNASPARAAQIAAEGKPPPKSLQIGLDLTVNAPEQVFVRGRGLDAELGGKLKVSGTADQPVILGDLNLRRGDFNLLSRRLDFQSGKVSFSGGKEINPILDFTATSKLEAADVTVTVGGTATRPTIGLHSSPELPQDELLAQLLFGKASGALSPFGAVQLAQAAAEITGLGSGGAGTLDKFRKTLGLDRLDIQSGEGSTGPSLSAGRYVTRNVFVGAKQGTDTKSSSATVEIELTPNLKVETDVGADASGKAGVNWEWNY